MGGWEFGVFPDRGWRYEKPARTDLVEKWPARVAAPGDVVGNPTAEAAEALSLTTKTRLVQGGADALIGMIGLGVAKPGQLCLITGSSHLQFGVMETPFHASGMSYQFRPRHADPRRHRGPAGADSGIDRWAFARVGHPRGTWRGALCQYRRGDRRE
jgi:sugar (pentulose or hexulose) kinase